VYGVTLLTSSSSIFFFLTFVMEEVVPSTDSFLLHEDILLRLFLLTELVEEAPAKA
jgi:hypothetical protein